MGNVARTAIGTAAAVGADQYLTGGKIASAGYDVAANVVNNTASGVATVINGIPTNAGVLPGVVANTNATPILGSAAPFATLATGGYSLYRGYSKTKEHGIARGTQEGLLSFGLISGLTTAAGLTAATPFTATAIAGGAGIWGARQLWNGGKAFFEKPGENIKYGINTPFRWTGKALSFLKGKKSA